ncbi:MAG: carboxypeptidase regulatory-like domain-containing protein [Syntrophus sp. (in: bacteria)]|nr:carboxypeptidase regulatory-like domain-containing protein [Syntrophus sp. (in: bacteria)]
MKSFVMLLSCLFILLFGYESQGYADESYVLPIEKREYQGVPYMSGGIGVDERKAFAAMGKDYSLKLMFALTGRHYLSDVKVEISDGIGKKVLDAVADGPWFFTDLPPGKYTVTVTMMGKAQQSAVNIGKGKKQTTLRFYWKE